MKMRIKDIISLPVETEAGDVVGKVVGIDLNIETHDVAAYHVRTGTFVRQLIGSDADLEILPVQVRSITQKKMVIADLSLKENSGAQSIEASAIPHTAQSTMSKLLLLILCFVTFVGCGATQLTADDNGVLLKVELENVSWPENSPVVELCTTSVADADTFMLDGKQDYYTGGTEIVVQGIKEKDTIDAGFSPPRGIDHLCSRFGVEKRDFNDSLYAVAITYNGETDNYVIKDAGGYLVLEKSDGLFSYTGSHRAWSHNEAVLVSGDKPFIVNFPTVLGGSRITKPLLSVCTYGVYEDGYVMDSDIQEEGSTIDIFVSEPQYVEPESDGDSMGKVNKEEYAPVCARWLPNSSELKKHDEWSVQIHYGENTDVYQIDVEETHAVLAPVTQTFSELLNSVWVEY